MNLPAPIARARMLARQTWDLWTGGTGGSSTALLAWSGAKTGDRLGRWWPPSTDFSSFLNPQLLKSRARDSVRNNAWACRAVNLLRDYAIGVGLKPQIFLPDAALRVRVNKLWGEWCDQADFTGRSSFYGLEAEAFRATLVDGEVLALIRPGPVLQIQLLSSEFLDTSRDNGVDIGGGIQYDDEGRRRGYWLYEKIPAQALNPVSRFVPADRVVHLFAPLHPGYERGISWLAPALVPLYELQTFMESSLVRARTGSLFAGFIRSADGSPILQNDAGDTTFEPGSMARLRPGDEIQFSTPPDPSMSHAPFVATQLRSIASALGLPYELLTGDLSQITFASGREGLLAFERTCEQMVQNLMAYQFCRPVWQWWTKIQVAAGTLPEDVLSVSPRWIGPEFETLDARMTVNSTLQKIRAGLLSRSEAVSATGQDPEALDEQVASDNARADKLGLIVDSDPRRVTLQGLEQPSEAQNAATTTIQ
jgi:lambda family phage portal protein